MKVLVEGRKVGNIPVLDVYETESKEKRPIIIILHGGNSRKEKYIERAYDFVKKGFFVSLFDAYGHGELKNQNVKYEITNIEKGNINELLRVYTETSQYINTIIASYGENNQYADSSKIGLLGVSMGAHTIYYHIMKERNPYIKVAVTINGSPIWKSFVRRYISNSSAESLSIEEKEVINIENYIESIQPLNYKETIKNFPLLMINGEKDELIPIDNIRKSYDLMKNDYIDKKLIKFVELEGIGHIVTPKSLEIACEWFKMHL